MANKYKNLIMKTSLLLIVTICVLASCKKEATIAPVKTTPVTTTQTTTTTTTQTTASATPVASWDTIPDKAVFRLVLAADDINTDETIVSFNKASKTGYDANEDGVYFAGYGKVSLSSTSSDGKKLAINSLPYTPGMSIGLNVNAKQDGAYSLTVNYEKSLPANVQIWVKDAYLKDSVNVRANICKFNVSKADTASFGSSRFKLVIREVAQQQQAQTSVPN